MDKKCGSTDQIVSTEAVQSGSSPLAILSKSFGGNNLIVCLCLKFRVQ